MKTENHYSNRTNSEGYISDNIPLLVFALVLCYLIYSVSLKQLPLELSDLNGHVYVYLSTFTGLSHLEGWKMAPYFLWHALVLFFNKLLLIPIDISASVTSALFALGSYFITAFMLRRWFNHIERKISSAFCGFLSFTLTILQPIWIEYLDAGVSNGIGTFSMNPLFNPTYMAARPFALCCFMLVIDLFALQDAGFANSRASETVAAADGTVFFKGGTLKISILLAISLFLSAMAKPVFAEMFIPAVGLMMLGKWFRHIKLRDGSGKKYFSGPLLGTFLIAVPCILCVIIQFAAFFIFGGSYGGDEGIVITGWLEVWSSFTENIPLSILLSMSFPILILIADSKNFLRSGIGQLGFVSYIVGFLECSILGEGGDKLLHGNFIWPMLFGMLMLWASSLLHFLVMEKKASGTLSKSIIIAGWILLLIHLHYGFLYIFSALEWDFFVI